MLSVSVTLQSLSMFNTNVTVKYESFLCSL